MVQYEMARGDQSGIDPVTVTSQPTTLHSGQSLQILAPPSID